VRDEGSTKRLEYTPDHKQVKDFYHPVRAAGEPFSGLAKARGSLKTRWQHFQPIMRVRGKTFRRPASGEKICGEEQDGLSG
jgi:hypothetical protein